MKVNVYSIYDRKAVTYGLPFFQPTDGSAIRSVQEIANDMNTTVGRHPTDFALFCIGTYDDQLGLMQPEVPLRHVIDAAALVQLQEPLPFDQPARAAVVNGAAV